MTTNKYLDKVASFIDKGVRFADDVIGHSYYGLKNEADTLARAEIKGRTAKQALSEAEDAKGRMVSARVKAGVGVVGATTAGFLGVHKYHQHRDDAILAKINQMYVDLNQK